MRRRASIAVVAAIAMLTLTACSPTRAELAEQRGDYLSQDGTVSQIAIDNRTTRIDFQGPGEDGSTINSSDYLGDVVVVNFWYASCAPCRTEAPWLQELSEQFEPDGVQFIGVNVRDDTPTSASFTKKFGITYPSIIDWDAQVTIAFAGIASPTAVPTTVVLDREGRYAARIVGIIDQPVLEGLIEATLEEDLGS